MVPCASETCREMSLRACVASLWWRIVCSPARLNMAQSGMVQHHSRLPARPQRRKQTNWCTERVTCICWRWMALQTAASSRRSAVHVHVVSLQARLRVASCWIHAHVVAISSRRPVPWIHNSQRHRGHAHLCKCGKHCASFGHGTQRAEKRQTNPPQAALPVPYQ
jgi:hypothetical protein